MTSSKRYPLLSGQKRLWIFVQQDKQNPAYNLQLTYHFRGKISYDILNQSTGLLFKRHYTMFSVFKQKDGNPYIEFIPRSVKLELIDFSGLPSDIRKEKIYAFAGEDSRCCFDIETGPLYRIFLLKENEESYYFHATIHHLIFDGWSRRIFVQELSDIYNNLILNKPVETEPIHFQSNDFAEQEELTHIIENEEELIEFWKENLRDCKSELKLPCDFPRKAYSSGLGRRETFEISKECSLRLKELGVREDVSLFNIAISLLGVLLQKYSDESDICIGIPVSSRRAFPLSEKIFGYFINTSIVRLDVDNKKSFIEQIRLSKEIIRNAIVNSRLPFERIVEAVKPERIPGINPLFQVSLSWLTNLTIPMNFGKVEGERITLPEGVSPFDLTFYMWEEGDRIRGDIEYSTDIFRQDTIVRLKESLIHLSNAIVDCPDESLSHISAITETEKQRIESFNNTGLSIPDCLIPDFFEKQSKSQPSKTAVISGDTRLTYKDLDDQSNRFARHILSLGVVSGDTVGICLERSAEMIIAIFGVLKAGCCYLPMDPGFPDDRIKYMFDDSGARVLISQSSLRKKFHEFPDASIVLIDSDNEKICRNSAEKPDPKIDNQANAYIIYTSGSTGKPKGVKVHHKSVVNLIESMSLKPGIKAEDILLAVVTLSFDMSVYEIFVTLSKGATLVIAGSRDVTDGTALINLVDQNNITVIQGTPAFWSILLSAGWKGKKGLKALCGGEALAYSLVHQMLPRVSEFWNCYGPTETTVYATCIQVTDENAPVLIGKPVHNTSVYIIDKDNKQLPVGVTGEVVIGGVCVTKGYHNKPELTEEKFIRFENNQIVYKTGDLGRFLEDGNVELFGRADNQIKLRGFRIEPGEIETLLAKFVGVRESVVKIHKFDETDERLVAFLNAEPDFKSSDEDIKLSLSKHLPAYMVPTFYQVSDGFPRLPNGKINKKALLFNLQVSDKIQEMDFDSLPELQKRLFSVWSQILKTQKFTVNDNFFNVGGNSLLGIRLINQIKEEFGFTLNFRDLLTCSTISQLGSFIESQTGKKGKSIDLVHQTDTKNLPLTNNQKRLWLISQIQPDLPSYIIRLTYRISGSFKPDLFEKSVGLLFKRHHIVFSVIREKKGEPLFEIIPSEVKIPFLDFTRFSETEKSEKITDLVNNEGQRAFDLVNGPLYRLYLIKTAADEYHFHISIHHIIFDGWSQSVLVNDLGALYNSQIREEDPGLEPLEFQQYDYADWECSQNDSPESLAFWEENLKGCSPILNFPHDFPRREQSSGRGGLEDIMLTRTLSNGLRRISREEGTSLFTTLMSAFGIQMHKYSGQDDLNIGMPVAYRPHSRLENIFGMFVNTVVIRLDFEKDATFRDMIKKTDEKAMNAISHQDISFDTVVDLLSPERVSGANPLFQVAFEWQNNLFIPLKLDGVACEKIKGKDRTANFDLTIALWENNDIIEGEIEYNTDLLKSDTIVRLKENYINLLQAIVENRNETISNFSVVSENDKKRIEKFNSTEVLVPEVLVQNLFEKQVVINPSKKAVLSGDSSLTYKELDEKANQLANHLISRGVNGGDVVGICLERSAEMVVSVLAVLKAGCCYLPMDPMFPDDRLKYMFEDSGARILISQSSLSSKLVEFNSTSVVLIDSDEENITHSSKTKPDLKITNQSLAYIIYTSGSTGKPKGVEVHHQAVVNFLNSMLKKPGIKKEDRLLGVTTLSFDISVLEVFLPLSSGAELVVAEIDDITDGIKLSGLIERNDITLMQATPATWNLLLATGWNGKRNMKTLCGGEAIPPSLISELLPKVESLWDMYGPTETTVWSTCCRLTSSEPPILVGNPIDNTRIYIIDKNNVQLPVGVVGEVCIGGLGVTKGYHNRPELTAEKFIVFENNQIVYKTGDQGRYLDNGSIELFGRIDNQIKLRGFRIEPGEIETLISKLQSVRESVIKIHRFEDGDERLVAFINADSDFKLNREEITSYLSHHLPAYMIPSFLHVSDGFPRLPNGKINKKALVYEPTESVQKEATDYSSLTETQKKIFTIWGAVLKTKSININDNFFDAGGNSLLGIRLINQIREEFGVAMVFRELIKNSTLSKLSAFIDSKRGLQTESIDLVHLTEMKNLPLTRNQKRLWLISKLQPDVPLYIIRSTYKLNGELDKEIFEKSLDILFRRHYIVFSVIKELNSEPYCDILPRDVTISFIDYSNLSEEEKQVKIKALLEADYAIPFDLEKGPLYRLYLIKTAVDECYFHMSIHHVIFDGWSQGVFVNDLSEIYNNLLKGEEIRLETLEFQQYDYANWEVSRGSRAESVAFWKENLQGCSPVLNFPYDFPRGKQTTGRGGLETVRLSPDLSNDLRRISKESGASLFTTLMSAFGLLIKKYSGEDDINIGLPVAYRPHIKLEKIFGMFVDTVVVRLKYEKEVSFRELIKKTDEAAINAISHQDLPFEDVVEIIKPERVSGANPLFQVAFAWQNNLSIPIKLEGVRSEAVRGDQRTATFDITLALWENGNIIQGEIEYNLDMLNPETIVRLKNNFLTLIKYLVADINAPVNKVPMISETEKRMILDINNTETIYPRDKTIVELVENHARLLPEHIAIAFKGKYYSYRQLNERANQLARTLRLAGVKKNSPVGLYADKSLEMIIAVLGILKAGGCYTPIDPEYPEQRINFIVKDSGTKILLVQEKYMAIGIEGVQKLSLNSESTYDNDNSNLPVINTPGDLAYILYTSGTTGIPKGTPIPHRGVIRMVCNTNYFNITSEDRVILAGAIVFDATAMEMWSALLNGASLHIIDKDTLLNNEVLEEEFVKNKITTFATTSALFTHLVESKAALFSQLKYLIVGGDVLSPAHANRVRKLNPKLTLINGYGPTENSCMSTFYKVEEDFDRSIPIGRPNSNSTVYIFDKDMNYQPVGVPGELYVGGDGLSSGYLNREDLNKTCFIEHPHMPGVRIYKTGDLVKWSQDLYIEFLGRADNQLKIRGFRIEIEEIESVLSNIDGVIEAVVKPVKVEEGDYTLVAFLNVPETFGLEAREILTQIRQKLPVYMIPSAFRYMHGFPKTVNGKTDKKALTFDPGELLKREKTDINSLTSTEKRVYNIWCNILKTDIVSAKDSFFEIGGNSLIGLRLMNLFKEEFGVSLTFKELVANPSISQLASLIDARSKGSEEEIKLVHLTDTVNLPLTKNQKRLWMISKLRPDVPSYIIRSTYRFRGTLVREAFEKSIDILFHRHHVVFSVIKENETGPYCEIVPTNVLVLYNDLEGLPEEERPGMIKKIIGEESTKMFDLEKGPLYRLFLIKTSINEHYFHISIHHIIFDGWSQGIFIEELNEIYNNIVKGNEVKLPDLEFQQYDYAQWESTRKDRAESIAFWEESLKGCSPVLNFPYDFKRSEQVSGKGGLEEIILPADLSNEVRRLSKETGASLFTTLMSAYGILINKYSGEDDINIGLPVAYRPHSKLERIFGMFVNTVVVRLQYENQPTFRDLIMQTDSATMNALSHQDLPFENVVEIVKPERVAGTNPLFQVAFEWQNNLSVPLKLEGLQSETIKKDEGSANFDLSLALWENGENIQGEFDYNIDILKHDSIFRLKNNFINLLHSLIENPDKPVAEISYLSEDDRKKIEEVNSTDCPYEHMLCIHHKFEQQVRENPDLPALLVKGETISYKELDEHANRMANYLIGRGIKVEDKVGICIDRSLEMMICIFGTLKAGAAYLPLSPENPTDRLRSIISDANSKLVLTFKASSANIPEESQIVFVDDIIEKPLSEDSINPEVKMSPRNLAYVLYTSGSTGTPKGVMIEHHSVLNRLGWMQKAYPIDKTDTLLQKTPITFDVSVWELFWWSFYGSKLVILPKGGEKDPEALIDYIADFKVTTIHFVPSMFASFFETMVTKKLCGKLEKMSRIFLSGEALPVSLVKDFNKVRDSYSLPDLINLYGPTEATVDVSYYDCPRENVTNVFIGKPIDNTRLFVVNVNNIIQPIGVPGELLITGVNLARGYINRPELTAEKFFDFRITDGQIIRAYHTGDLVKLTPEGEIDYLGRMDNQVKIRGFRIELGDIEAKILEHPMVTHSAVIVIEKGQYKYLVAYVCLKQGSILVADKLRNFLSGKLPDYMVPPYIIFLDELPLTSSGKLNRKSLPAPDSVMERSAIVKPSNKSENMLFEIWKNLLKIENISINDNFFDIGGNSLLAINLANAISREFNIPVKALMIFEYPSIKAQSEFVSGNREDDLSNKNIEIDEKTKSKKNVNFKRLRG